jgi:hypothetical protein
LRCSIFAQDAYESITAWALSVIFLTKSMRFRRFPWHLGERAIKSEQICGCASVTQMEARRERPDQSSDIIGSSY